MWQHFHTASHHFEKYPFPFINMPCSGFILTYLYNGRTIELSIFTDGMKILGCLLKQRTSKENKSKVTSTSCTNTDCPFSSLNNYFLYDLTKIIIAIFGLKTLENAFCFIWKFFFVLITHFNMKEVFKVLFLHKLYWHLIVHFIFMTLKLWLQPLQ